MFNRIPPAGTGGSFNLCSTESHRREPVDRSIPAYKDWKDSPESHHRQVVDRSSPTCSLNNGKQGLGLNDPPPASGGILEDSQVFCRSGLNDPPPAGGGIPESPNLCRYRWMGQARGILGRMVGVNSQRR